MEILDQLMNLSSAGHSLKQKLVHIYSSEEGREGRTRGIANLSSQNKVETQPRGT